ncbi:hypothetical protein RF11_01397 [Thelohanellus kitauei]|uniref:Uncharacterized protein n=1 Tax=Thelohanellus kitauei TaxID=669202 RepID=A0A0C2ND04_THEKT|nr:hypothetical protein RF11_01397 [Thelohanellus kitauei]
MRNTPSKGTSYSPAQLVYNTSLRGPSDARFIAFVPKREITDNGHVNDGKIKLRKYIDDYKKAYDQKTTSKEFKLGQQVLIKRPITTAMDRLYDGPYKVVERNPPNYTIGNSDNGSITVVHHNRLKLYKDYSCLEDTSDDEIEEADASQATIPKNTEQSIGKRRIKIPEENLEFVKQKLPSFLERGVMSGDRRTQVNRAPEMCNLNGQST